MLTHIKDVLKKAEKGKYAIGAFHSDNLETTLGILRAAEEEKSPVIILVTPKSIKYAGLKPITHLVQTSAKNIAQHVPVVLHLDHGNAFHEEAECIQAGFSSIMIDASHLPFDENVFLTKKVVEYGHRYGVYVQGEIGRVPKTTKEAKESFKKPSDFMTIPEEAAKFVKQTKVDTLAVGVGNIHGKFKITHKVKLDHKRLIKIDKLVKVPLVLHGASCLKENDIKKAIKNGVRIINIHTEISMAYAAALRKELKKDKKEIDPRRIMSPVIQAVKKVVQEKIIMFGSKGKA
jgi:fructose-bisphosphate aldolase, class II